MCSRCEDRKTVGQSLGRRGLFDRAAEEIPADGAAGQQYYPDS